MEEHAIYQIGLKVLLHHNGLFLLMKDAWTGHFDLPGGRMDSSEKQLPLSEILAREIREELGNSVLYALGSPLFQYRRVPFRPGTDVFITVYDGEFISGTITLSEEHSSYEWIDPKSFSFKKEDFGNEEEYIAMQHYFDSLKI
ncbi:MAG TPA: NUDIX hydrolase [Candidatus Andersenbacteria bacterium]|nr:NUDIX hydrolase [Candidatus Andersenbacteria bacterium]